jgi:hypothetical protein
MDRAQLIIMVCGAILIIFGLGLIAVQMWVQVTAPEIEFQPRGISLETMGTKASVNTRGYLDLSLPGLLRHGAQGFITLPP